MDSQTGLKVFSVILAVSLILVLLWRNAATVRRWEREAALWNAWSGCQMTTAEYRAWRGDH